VKSVSAPKKKEDDDEMKGDNDDDECFETVSEEDISGDEENA